MRTLDEILGLCKCPHFIIIKNVGHCYSTLSKACLHGTVVHTGSRCWTYHIFGGKSQDWHIGCEFYDLMIKND